MTVRVALDTSVIVYAEGLQRAHADSAKVAFAARLIAALGSESLLAPLQVLAELHWTMTRKGRLAPLQASAIVARWARRAETIASDRTVFDCALELATQHRLAIFDAVILAAAVEGRADLLLSEDLQDGFTFRGVTVANPFATRPEPRLARLLA